MCSLHRPVLINITLCCYPREAQMLLAIIDYTLKKIVEMIESNKDPISCVDIT